MTNSREHPLRGVTSEIAAAYDEGRLAAGTFAQLCDPDGIAIAPTNGGTVVIYEPWLARTYRWTPSPGSPAPRASTRGRGGINPIKWAGGEHTYLGNNATLHFDDGDQPGKTPIALHNGLRLSYGQLIALAGDFYGLVDAPISEDPSPPARFYEAYDSLAKARAAVSEAPKILQIMQTEIDAVNNAIRNGQEPSTAYATLGDSLDKQWNVLTGGGCLFTDLWPFGRYLALADTNYDHFGQHAARAYLIGHGEAVAKAVAAHGIADSTQRRAQLAFAYTLNAFADHFLTDLFSAGHMRTPRQELSYYATPHATGSFCAKCMHDEDNCWGLKVQNGRGQQWTAFGDNKLLDKGNATNLKIVQAALQDSIDDVYLAYKSGKVPPNPSALTYVPNLSIVSDYTQRINPSPLFIRYENKTNNTIEVQRRDDLKDRLDYSWGTWDETVTAAKLRNLSEFQTCGSSEIPIELEVNVLRLRNNNGWLGLTVFGPHKAGGYGVLWNNDNIGAGAGALAWLRVNDDLQTRIVQPWDNNGVLGMIIYAPDGGNGYKISWSNTNMGTRSAAVGWFACKAGVDRTNIVQLRNDNGLLGITTYSPDSRGGYKLAWSRDTIDPHAGAGANYWFKCTSAGNRTSIMQLWNNNGTVGMILYVPDGDDGYQVGWGNPNMGAGIEALAWLTVENGGQTHIIQVWNSGWNDGQTITINRYSPDGKGGYTLASRQGYYEKNVSGIWLVADFLRGRQDLVHLYNNGGMLAGSFYNWPFAMKSPFGIENMGIDPGQDPGALGWVTLHGDRDITRLVRFRNVNGDLGMALFEPESDSFGGWYQLAGRNDDLRVPANSIAFFALEKELT